MAWQNKNEKNVFLARYQTRPKVFGSLKIDNPNPIKTYYVTQGKRYKMYKSALSRAFKRLHNGTQ